MPRVKSSKQLTAHFTAQIGADNQYGPDIQKLQALHASLGQHYSRLTSRYEQMASENQPQEKLEALSEEIHALAALSDGIADYMGSCIDLKHAMEKEDAAPEEQQDAMNTAAQRWEDTEQKLQDYMKKYPYGNIGNLTEFKDFLQRERFTDGKQYLDKLGIEQDTIISEKDFVAGKGFKTIENRKGRGITTAFRKLNSLAISGIKGDPRISLDKSRALANKFIDFEVALTKLVGYTIDDNDRETTSDVPQLSNELKTMAGFKKFLHEKDPETGLTNYEMLAIASEQIPDYGREGFDRDIRAIEQNLQIDAKLPELRRERSQRELDLGFVAGEEKTWKNYMNLHYGDASRMNAEALAKVMVGAMHEYNKAVRPTPFNLKEARREAKLLQKSPAFKQLMKSPERVQQLLTSETPIKDIAKTAAGALKPFAASKENTLQALRNLKKLGQDFMDPPEGRSDKWADLVHTLRNLERMDLRKITPGNEQRYEQKLQEIFTKVEDYAKGKKSLRRHEDGQNRFNQDMDVLAELSKVSPAAKDLSQRIIDRTNVVRRGHDANHVDITLDQFGLAHAAEHVNPEARGEEAEIQGGNPQL